MLRSQWMHSCRAPSCGWIWLSHKLGNWRSCLQSWQVVGLSTAALCGARPFWAGPWLRPSYPHLMLTCQPLGKPLGSISTCPKPNHSPQPCLGLEHRAGIAFTSLPACLGLTPAQTSDINTTFKVFGCFILLLLWMLFIKTLVCTSVPSSHRAMTLGICLAPLAYDSLLSLRFYCCLILTLPVSSSLAFSSESHH